MRKLSNVVLGINHMFLYPQSMVDGDVHTESLRELAAASSVEALDCWVWANHAEEEIRILKESGKVINYNVGDRFGECPSFPASTNANERAYALDRLRRESDFAMECGAKKIIFASGKGVDGDHEGSLKRFEEFVLEWSETLPKDICLCLEPTDWDIDKRFLLGSLEDTVACVESIRKEGRNIGILLDMGHIPIMHETISSAIEKTASYLTHIHLGNCVIKDSVHPLYGDKHPHWGMPGGEYGEQDGTMMLQLLKKFGYFSGESAQTVSFEMRTLPNMNAIQTTDYLCRWFHKEYSNL